MLSLSERNDCLFEHKLNRFPHLFEAHPPKLMLVAKSKTMLFLDLNAFIPSVKIDFATSI
jgi:hypothetical protein